MKLLNNELLWVQLIDIFLKIYGFIILKFEIMETYDLL